ncbi:DEAD/DEAH box helicase family protein [Pedobacter caeni]|uniref:Type III restriction enzyme, res subunit n=1 Tax=Pedobacter caeni TaxID=288992 RepID=A0A1M5E9P2_9SPHI|nr:DEAD/DEAH box helicase family protein [Pedobacter caeni]SHF75905.1 Type III restriction enzyme, res subunit [Pedobacter caeni]
MINFPEETKFKYSWRKYQQKVLDGLDDHLQDRHLHVIAPPGSGKTVLGLEVALRLNQPTLILAPTIAIRNQWIQRFCELFLQTHLVPDWISKDIRNPKFLTIVTYQGLHAACNYQPMLEVEAEAESEEEQEPEEEVVKKNANQNLGKIISGLKAQQVKTIVVDEAHHLQNEWWYTLTKVKQGLDPIIVGLTATPPYDVTPNEWQRYLELNGPVDIEIAVPELIIEGDLCPHQDYVFFTLPTLEENESINDFRNNVARLFGELKNDETLIRAISAHPAWLNPAENLEWIYSNISFYSATLIFLHSNGLAITEAHLEVIGEKQLEVPAFDYSWIEVLLDFYLYKEPEHFKEFEEHRKNLENRLRRSGALERRQVNFKHNKKVTGFLTSSISKLNGIKQIVDFEYRSLGAALRLVILSDFIRKEFYLTSTENNVDLNKIGVIPIFEKLRRDNSSGLKIGVLTGSMVIIPKSAYPAFEEKAKKSGIGNVNCTPVPFDANYILINQTDQLSHELVHIITQIFQKGEIEVLIGTKSLLGEGWDAPAINALILASFIGSFVLSNQMRGRAIRTQNGNKDKTGNIWHLVCIDPTSFNGGDDFDLLKRRFRSFVGVSFKEEPAIENGAGRLNIPLNIHLKKEIEAKNTETFSFAGDRNSLKERWRLALQSGVNLVEEIKIPFAEKRPFKGISKMYWNRTLRYLISMLGFSIISFLFEFPGYLLRAGRNIRSMNDFFLVLGGFAAVGFFVLGSLAFKTFKLYLKYRDISKDIQEIGDVLLKTLIHAGIFKTDPAKLQVQSSVDELGAVYSHLEGGTAFEKSTFINALVEIIGPIDNPRYVIVRKSNFMSFRKQEDFHSVPEVIGRKKEFALYFRNLWEVTVGSCDLIYTRTMEGRRLLLKSRVNALAAQFDEKVEQVNKWR